MMKTNVSRSMATLQTHEGGPARVLDAASELRRALMACLLFEDTFYENGVEIAQRIHDLSTKVPVADVAALAVEARTVQGLRHAPLWLALGLIKRGATLRDLLPQIMKRPDDMTEFLAMYWKDGRKPIPAQVKKGLRAAFSAFSPYQLAKYANRDGIKLRDVMFLVHPEAKTKDLEDTYKLLAEDKLGNADTWEVAISAAGNDEAKRRAEWNRLLSEGKLGSLALLRNLRNISEAGVPFEVVKGAMENGLNDNRVWPLQYFAALRHAPHYALLIQDALDRRMKLEHPLAGSTAILVDVSGSMTQGMAGKSQLSLMDAAAAMAATFKGEQVRLFSFSDEVVEVPFFNNMGTADMIVRSQNHHGTHMGAAVATVAGVAHFDRLIVITDEQSADRVPNPPRGCKGYIMNVATAKNGVGYGPWTHINGFSQAAWKYIEALEGAA